MDVRGDVGAYNVHLNVHFRVTPQSLDFRVTAKDCYKLLQLKSFKVLDSTLKWCRISTMPSNSAGQTTKDHIMKDYALAIAIGLALALGALHYFDALIK